MSMAGDSGMLGEAAAARYLRRKGYRICAANYRTRFGEIDIICQTGPFLVFVEVKTRGVHMRGTPREAVDRPKQQRLLRTAGLYLVSHPGDWQPRFDVIEVYLDEEGEVRAIEQIEHAFEASGATR